MFLFLEKRLFQNICTVYIDNFMPYVKLLNLKIIYVIGKEVNIE